MTRHEATADVVVAASPERVWRALTDPGQIAEYMMGSRVDTDWQPGSPITWSGEWQGKAYQDKGEVLELEPGTRLVVTHYSPRPARRTCRRATTRCATTSRWRTTAPGSP